MVPRDALFEFQLEDADLPTPPTYALKPAIPTAGRSFTSASPLMVKQIQPGTGIFNLFPIAYAFRPRLRVRLTLSRLTLLRKPWVFGDTVFHSVYRYLCQHFLFCTLHHASRHSFTAYRMLFYRSCEPIASVVRLSPANYRRLIA